MPKTVRKLLRLLGPRRSRVIDDRSEATPGTVAPCPPDWPSSQRVVTNALCLKGNPYLTLWSDAARRSGVTLAPLAKETIFTRRAARHHWVHLQWPELVLDYDRTRFAAGRLVRMLGLLAVARLRGARLLVTAHNVWSHDARHPLLERVLWRSLGVFTTDVHLLCGAGADEFFAHHHSLNRARRHVIPHGHYGPVITGAPDRATARALLGLPRDARVLCTFGHLKSSLLVAGLPSPRAYRQRATCRGSKRLANHDGQVVPYHPIRP